MKKLLFFHIILLLILNSVHSQSSVLKTRITISYQNTSILDVLTGISQKYSIGFYYNSTIPDLQKKINIELKEATLETALSKLFENTALIYQTDGNKILLNTAPKTNQKVVIHGYLYDSESKETLIGATILIKNTNIGTTTNSFGFYSLTIPSIPNSIELSYIGYNDTTLVISKSENSSLNIALTSKTVKMQEVVITSEKSAVSNSQTGYNKLSMYEVKSLPAFMGENDIIRTIQLTPGIKSGNEASSGFYVRGGGPDQNLVLLDGATLYNTTHSMNLFSVFNPDVIKNAEISKSGFPARYGGRLSSVIDINMKDGNMEKYTGEFAIGYLLSKMTLEGPIIKGKTSFIISARRSFIDLFTRWSMPIDEDTTVKFSLVFYDASAKVNHKFSDKDRIFASFYVSGDGFGFREEARNPPLQYISTTDANIKWKNLNGAIRWNHLISDKLFSNTTFLYSRFNFFVDIQEGLDYSDELISDYYFSNRFGSTIEDFGIRTDFDYFPNSRHSIKYGISAQKHNYKPGVSAYRINYESNTTDTAFSNEYHTSDFYVYFEDDLEITKNLKANIGIHASLLATDSKIYPTLQPRISMRYSLSASQSIKASYSRMSQNIHLLTSGGQMLPLDLWVPATDKIPPMSANQYSIGYALGFQHKYEFIAETYYKQMNNLIEYKEGANFTDMRIPWEEKVYSGGKGKSYGLELFIQKKSGDLTGWIGYTISRVNRTFDEIDNGKAFPYKFDKPHDISIVSMYKINERINLSGSWVFSTGYAFSFPEGTYPTPQNFIYPSATLNTGSVQYYQSRNAVRMPNYHRLDLGINFVKEKKHGTRTWNISVYNVYARQNPFYIYATTDSNGNRKMKQVTMYSILPSFSYSYKFK